MKLQANTVEEVQSIVKSNYALLPYAGGSKPALSAVSEGVTRLDMSGMSGIIEYEPGEYTFTAYAGTPVRDVVETLAEHGQYLPFDPLLVDQGATLGGIVASNTAGSGRYRYGGVRDFILGIHFVDGYGQLVLGGGKVVKNAAGFDLPKFMVGSLGRFGIFIDLSFKVFPQPRAYVTLKMTYPNLDATLQALHRLSTSSFEMDGLDLEPLADGQYSFVIRMGGLVEALPGRTARLQQFLSAETGAGAGEIVQGEADRLLWQEVNNLAWANEGLSLVKVPISPKTIPDLEASLSDVPRRYTVGGNVAWFAVSDAQALEAVLTRLGLAGLMLFGAPGRAYVGLRKGLALEQRVKQALDPNGRFLAA